MQVIKYVEADGDIATWPIKLSNKSVTAVLTNVQILFTIPTGVSLTGPTDAGSFVINVPAGYMDVPNSTWFVGDMQPGDILDMEFEFTVDDITEANPADDRFIVNAEIIHLCDEDDLTDNSEDFVIQVGVCVQIDLGLQDGDNADLSFE